MSFWNKLKTHANAQFLDVLEWLDSTNDTLVWRFPVFNQAITDSSKLIVRESQAAVFAAEGKLSDVFAPGTYTLDTRNTPVISFFQSIAYNFNYPYKGDVYFVSTRQFTDNGWGTQRPFMLRDAEFGPIRVRAFGIYSFRITDPAVFLRQIVGTDGLFTTDEITGQLKKKMVALFTAEVARSKIPILDLAASYLEIGDQIREKINPAVQESYGITITDFTISNIGLPPEVEEALDNRSRMGVLGNLDAYAKLQAAEALGDAARNPGLGGAGVGMGVGIGMGNMMGGMVGQAHATPGVFNPHTNTAAPAGATPPPLPAAKTYHYDGPSGKGQLSATDISARIQADPGGRHLLWDAGWPSWKAWSDVPEIAALMPPTPPSPPAPPTASVSTYHYSGPAGKGEKTVAEIVAIVQAEPDGAHHLWKNGFEEWLPALDVPEVAAELGSVPPPPPE